MEKGKMAVRMCLVFVVMAAVFIGIFYYYNDVQKQSINEGGTLITAIGEDWYFLWEE